MGALLVRLPMSPNLGADLFLGGLLGAPDSASQVAATVEGREPWMRRGIHEGEETVHTQNFKSIV